MNPEEIRALTFDVFGTVVDWRSSLIREGEAFGRAHRLDVDWVRFADAWRGLYQPTLERVRSGSLPWTKLDDLHRMALDRLLAEFGVRGLAEAELGLEPRQCLMVAAHNNDLAAAEKVGFHTAFVTRPTEYGPAQKTDPAASQAWDVARLGC